jgi:hypothetical protein
VSRRSLALIAGGSFFAGIGATALAAYLQLRRENVMEDRTVWDLDRKIKKLESDVLAARDEASSGRYHVEALLRGPDVSASDHTTDRVEATKWLRRIKNVD